MYVPWLTTNSASGSGLQLSGWAADRAGGGGRVSGSEI